MQSDFIRPGETPFWIPEATRMIPRLAALLGAVRQAGLPVIFTAFGETHHFLDRPASGAFMPNRYPLIPSANHAKEPEFAPNLLPDQMNLFY
jgi:nicotinamidase-related amidase